MTNLTGFISKRSIPITFIFNWVKLATYQKRVDVLVINMNEIGQ